MSLMALEIQWYLKVWHGPNQAAVSQSCDGWR